LKINITYVFKSAVEIFVIGMYKFSNIFSFYLEIQFLDEYFLKNPQYIKIFLEFILLI